MISRTVAMLVTTIVLFVAALIIFPEGNNVPYGVLAGGLSVTAISYYQSKKKH